MIIGFYSYKGGVGRSIAMLNTAVLMAQGGKNVGLIDLDLEAASILQILRIESKDSEGLLDILLSGHIPYLSNLVIRLNEIIEKRYDLKLKGDLLFVPTVTDYDKLGRLDFRSEFTTNLFEKICEHYIEVFRLDHLLIDLRTGFYPATSSGLYLSDRIVLVFRLDNQNLVGIKRIIDYCEQKHKAFVLVASLIPETRRTDEYLQRFQRELGRGIKVKLAYDADLALEEKIAILDYPQKNINQGFRTLVDLLEGRK